MMLRELMCIYISIHALRGEGDRARLVFILKRTDFNPRPPWGGRRLKIRKDYISCLCISIHALRGEGDGKVTERGGGNEISIHALRGEGDCKNIQICNIVFVHSAYKTIYFCDSCAFYLT